MTAGTELGMTDSGRSDRASAFADALEWESKSTLESDREVSYAGVSLLTFDADGKVSRCATYYDTAKLTLRVA